MYLKRVIIEHSGPIKSLDFTLAFNDAGLPKPLVLVGPNGSGKSNLLSLITDAIFEAAAAHHDNVLPMRGADRAWFRLVGGRNLTVGALGGFSLLAFEDNESTIVYKEKAGTLNNEDIKERLPADFTTEVNWPEEGNYKDFSIESERSRKIFASGVYACFPASRSEIPHWINSDYHKTTQFETSPSIAKKLKKPIYVEKAIEQFQQWLMSAITDSRGEIAMFNYNGITKAELSGDNLYSAIDSLSAISVANTILRKILDNDSASFIWMGRKSSEKIGIAANGKLFVGNLNALSSGQSILLGLFGTLLRYGDLSANGAELDLENIKGICLVDEIDAHVHVDLQNRVLPILFKMFPKVQFILTNHSPLFVLGLEREYGSDAIQVIEMPNGLSVAAESYAEFGKALEAMAATNAFAERVAEQAKVSGKPIVYVEGETDAPYLERAAQLRGKAHILNMCDIEWIGAKDESGQGFNTGKDALKHALSVFKANPNLVNRKILLLHDNDSTSSDHDYNGISVRKIPQNPNNTKINVGIENLLDESCIDDRFYEEKTKTKNNGDSVVTRTLGKTALCEFVCQTGKAEHFAAFDEALQVIENFLQLASSGSTAS